MTHEEEVRRTASDAENLARLMLARALERMASATDDCDDL